MRGAIQYFLRDSRRVVGHSEVSTLTTAVAGVDQFITSGWTVIRDWMTFAASIRSIAIQSCQKELKRDEGTSIRVRIHRIHTNELCRLSVRFGSEAA